MRTMAFMVLCSQHYVSVISISVWQPLLHLGLLFPHQVHKRYLWFLRLLQPLFTTSFQLKTSQPIRMLLLRWWLILGPIKICG